MFNGNGRIIHCKSEQRLRLKRFVHRYASTDRHFIGVARKVGIAAVVTDVHRIVTDTDLFQHIAKTDARPLWTAHRARRPLVTRCRRIEFATTIPSALERDLQANDFKR